MPITLCRSETCHNFSIMAITTEQLPKAAAAQGWTWQHEMLIYLLVDYFGKVEKGERLADLQQLYSSIRYHNGNKAFDSLHPVAHNRKWCIYRNLFESSTPNHHIVLLEDLLSSFKDNPIIHALIEHQTEKMKAAARKPTVNIPTAAAAAANRKAKEKDDSSIPSFTNEEEAPAPAPSPTTALAQRFSNVNVGEHNSDGLNGVNIFPSILGPIGTQLGLEFTLEGNNKTDNGEGWVSSLGARAQAEPNDLDKNRFSLELSSRYGRHPVERDGLVSCVLEFTHPILPSSRINGLSATLEVGMMNDVCEYHGYPEGEETPQSNPNVELDEIITEGKNRYNNYTQEYNEYAEQDKDTLTTGKLVPRTVTHYVRVPTDTDGNQIYLHCDEFQGEDYKTDPINNVFKLNPQPYSDEQSYAGETYAMNVFQAHWRMPIYGTDVEDKNFVRVEKIVTPKKLKKKLDMQKARAEEKAKRRLSRNGGSG